jgi:hypothetical protein
MRFLLFTLVLLLSTQTFAKINIFDSKNYLSNNEKAKLNGEVTNALNFFNTFKTFTGEINIDISPSTCLRTSYNYIDKRIAFCKTKNTIFMGLNSIDIINHEVFHYLYCHTYPKNCLPQKMKNEVIQSFHEGLADLFAFQINPDNYFGENYRVDIPYLRKYKTSLCYKYTYSSHQKGNALASYLIENNFTLSSIETFLNTMELSDLPSNNCLTSEKFQLIPKNRETSKKNKYWIKLNEQIEFSYELEASYKLRTSANIDLFEIQIQDNKVYINSLGKKGFMKIILYITKDDKIVGETRLYIGAR